MGGVFGLPLRIETVAIPQLGQFPALGQGESPAPLPVPLSAPAANVWFRPEQEQRPSGEHDVLIPVAGSATATWITPWLEESFPALTSIGIPELQQPQEASMSASWPSIAGIPSASHMQFANQERLPIFPGNEVGMQENGAARHSSPLSCVMKA